ncbi:MAG TPA: hypothetical protein VJR89_05545 [Polyangiales bacterium]|nr:hypothetical protein [Polyangiales bacterium]
MRRAWISSLVWLVAACSAEVVQRDEGAELFAQVSALIDRSCAKQVCHGDMVMNARLSFMTGDLRGVLVDVPACEYDRMPRVAAGDPNHSWLMIKLAGPQRFVQYLDFLDFMPDVDWTPAVAECSGSLPDGRPWFGTRMPPVDSTQPLDPNEVELVRRWIELGAPLSR